MRALAMIAMVGLCVPGCGKKSNEPKSDEPIKGGATGGAGGSADAATAGQTKDAAFAVPESVLHLAGEDVYLVSNINGSPLDRDDNGFIARVGPDTLGEAQVWISGAAADVELNAPKGMAVLGDTLYVADIDTVRTFDAKTGAKRADIAIEGATFLNDMATGDGVVYVSDSGLDAAFEPSGTDAIYSLTPGDGGPTITKLIAGAELGHPNGVWWDGERVWVVTFGSGELYSISADGKRENVSKPPKGQLDGICAARDGTLIISSWEGSAVYQRATDGSFSEIVTGAESPADIACDVERGRVVIPLFNGNALRVEPLPGAAEPTGRKDTKCQDIEKQVERALAALDRTCASDADCEGTSFGCPFGCSVPIRKGADTSAVQTKVDRYHEMCGLCKYKCGQVEVRCVNKQCTNVDP